MPRIRWIHLLVSVATIVTLGLVIYVPVPSPQDNLHNFTAESSNLLMLKLKDRLYSMTLDSLFISVKTTEKFHTNRLYLILMTWFNEAPEQIYFFSDLDDTKIQEKTKNHLINTGCSSSHSRKALCCKMSVELETFIRTQDKKWFCHFDDDNYVNVYQLVKLLQEYNPNEDWYLGKISTNIPIVVQDKKKGKNVSFWFATGGAGFCLSRSLVTRMTPFVAGGKFRTIGDDIRLPDDVTLGYIVDYLLNVPVTVIHKFHSHLEPLKSIKFDRLADQISLSFSNTTGDMNVIDFGDNKHIKLFDAALDPTRLLSLHCFLVPSSSYCSILDATRAP